MIHTGICPYCGKRVPKVKVEDVDMEYGRFRLRGYSYQCPSCKSVLGVQMNPRALNDHLKDDILKEVEKML